MKKQKYLIFGLGLLMLSISAYIAKADGPLPMDCNPIQLIAVAIRIFGPFTVFTELIIGYIFFLRSFRGLLAIFSANVISYALFTLATYLYISNTNLLAFSGYYTQIYTLSYILFVIFCEVIIFLLEALIIRMIMGKQFAYRRAFFISFVLNVSSLLLGFAVGLIFHFRC
jgi:hypothetical protein